MQNMNQPQPQQPQQPQQQDASGHDEEYRKEMINNTRGLLEAQASQEQQKNVMENIVNMIKINATAIAKINEMLKIGGEDQQQDNEDPLNGPVSIHNPQQQQPNPLDQLLRTLQPQQQGQQQQQVQQQPKR